MSTRSIIKPVNDLYNATVNCIDRTAICSTGRIGSIYDAYKDRILGHLNVQHATENDFQEYFKCTIIKDEIEQKNIIDLINLEDELRLSIILHLLPKTKMVSLFEEPQLKRKHLFMIRFFHQKFRENLSEFATKNHSKIRQPIPGSVTHVITGVTWGFDVIVLIEFSYETVDFNRIDNFISQIKANFEGKHQVLISMDEEIIKQIISAKAYSNAPDLNEIIDFTKICTYMNEMINSPAHYPILYTIEPISCLYTEFAAATNWYYPLPEKNSMQVRTYVINLKTKLNMLEACTNQINAVLLYETLWREFRSLSEKRKIIQKQAENELNELADLVISIRNGTRVENAIDERLMNGEKEHLLNDISELTERFNILKKKNSFIHSLHEKNITYMNVPEDIVNGMNNENIEERILKICDQSEWIICSNDELNEDASMRLEERCDNLISKREISPNLRISYVDFSYSSFSLKSILIFSTPLSRAVQLPLATQPQSSDIVNIVLFGETGVGKSTFINALANYLTFNTFSDAEKSAPVVLIPVSFTLTTGQNFDECQVKYGNTDTDILNNENFGNCGHSVTQFCKSYVFRSNLYNGQKVRIIDTPGFGDTRGTEQDELNLENILNYLKNITHLNAVCFLLKPNVERLHIFFRKCFKQLFEFLSPNIYPNIIFCFTNTRATFFAPGNTSSLIKRLLESLSIENITLRKQNTYCFDSESFRYLVSLKNHVNFEDDNKIEYEKSWLISVKETNRLLEYIHNKLHPFDMQHLEKSHIHAQLEIKNTIQPMLEAVRNLYRNKLLTSKTQNQVIELKADAVKQPAVTCLSKACKQKKIAGFTVFEKSIHEIKQKCYKCNCKMDQHQLINCIIRFECVSKINDDDLESILAAMLDTCVVFGRYFKKIKSCLTRDPLEDAMEQMIKEEIDNIDFASNSCCMNSKLIQLLTNMQSIYKQQLESTPTDSASPDVDTIYEKLSFIHNVPMVYEQINAFKEGQIAIMQYYEHEIDNYFGQFDQIQVAL